MMARLLTLVSTVLAVAISLVGFILQEVGKTEWWTVALNRGGYALVALGIVGALLSLRAASVIGLALQVLAALAALAFLVVALVKYYTTGAMPFGVNSALEWAAEAQVFSIAALAFGLTLARRRSMVAVAALAAAVAIAVGSGVYAMVLQGNFAVYLWWIVAGVGAFLAASAAATLERSGGGVALRAPVPSSAGGGVGSDSGVE